MASLVRYRSTLERADLVRVTKGWRALHGTEIRFGAMGPRGSSAPEHTGHDGRPKGVTTNDILAFIEFGVQGRAERPVIRYVMRAHERELRKGAAEVARAIGQKRAHLPILESLGKRLVGLVRARIQDVGAVDTGQTRDSIDYVIEKGGLGG